MKRVTGSEASVGLPSEVGDVKNKKKKKKPRKGLTCTKNKANCDEENNACIPFLPVL